MEQDSTQRVRLNYEHSGGLQGVTLTSPQSILSMFFAFCDTNLCFRQWIRLHFCKKKGKDYGKIFYKAAWKRTQTRSQGADCGISFISKKNKTSNVYCSFSILMFADLKKYQFYYW